MCVCRLPAYVVLLSKKGVHHRVTEVTEEKNASTQRARWARRGREGAHTSWRPSRVLGIPCGKRIAGVPPACGPEARGPIIPLCSRCLCGETSRGAGGAQRNP